MPKHKMIRQGDVGLFEVETVPVLPKKKDLIIAEGEATGHHHQFTDPSVQLTQGDAGFFAVLDQPAILKHDEHAALEIPQGTYQIRQQRERTLLGLVQQVRD